MKIVWLRSARRDIESIGEYLEAEASKAVARRVIQAIVRSASLLIDQPSLGHPSATTDGVHEWQVPRTPYVLPYRVIDDRIEILRVFHQAREKPERWR